MAQWWLSTYQTTSPWTIRVGTPAAAVPILSAASWRAKRTAWRELTWAVTGQGTTGLSREENACIQNWRLTTEKVGAGIATVGNTAGANRQRGSRKTRWMVDLVHNSVYTSSKIKFSGGHGPDDEDYHNPFVLTFGVDFYVLDLVGGWNGILLIFSTFPCKGSVILAWYWIQFLFDSRGSLCASFFTTFLRLDPNLSALHMKIDRFANAVRPLPLLPLLPSCLGVLHWTFENWGPSIHQWTISNFHDALSNFGMNPNPGMISA